jgi:zinc finger protein 830
MTAAEVEQKAAEEEEQAAERRAKADVEIEDDREDAARALEQEFDEMEELEARVRRLKQKREELRNTRSASIGQADAAGVKGLADGRNKENVAVPAAGLSGDKAVNGAVEEDEDEDEDNDDDEWDDGFRFRTTAQR